MTDSRRKILQMLAKGKITADEAERLLNALNEEQSADQSPDSPTTPAKPKPRFLKLQVREVDGDKVDVQIPLDLLRAGVKLSTLIPKQAQAKVNAKMAEKGIDIDFAQALPDQLNRLIDYLQDMAVNVEEASGSTVRIFCE